MNTTICWHKFQYTNSSLSASIASIYMTSVNMYLTCHNFCTNNQIPYHLSVYAYICGVYAQWWSPKQLNRSLRMVKILKDKSQKRKQRALLPIINTVTPSSNKELFIYGHLSGANSVSNDKSFLFIFSACVKAKKIFIFMSHIHSTMPHNINNINGGREHFSIWQILHNAFSLPLYG